MCVEGKGGGVHALSPLLIVPVCKSASCLLVVLGQSALVCVKQHSAVASYCAHISWHEIVSCPVPLCSNQMCG